MVTWLAYIGLKSTTIKGFRHATIFDNTIREAICEKLIHIKHKQGESNLEDIFTKEHKDIQHFLTINDHISPEPFDPN